MFTDKELEQLLDRSDMMKIKDESEAKVAPKRKHPDSNAKQHFAVLWWSAFANAFQLLRKCMLWILHSSAKPDKLDLKWASK